VEVKLMKLRKLLAATVSCAIALSAMVTLAATASADSVKVKLQLRECKNWAKTYESAELTLTGDGTYTISAKGEAGIDKYCMIAINQVGFNNEGNGSSAPAAPAEFADAKVTINSVTINGSAATFKDGNDIDLLNPDDRNNGGKVNVELWNAWHEPNQRLTGISKDSDNYLDIEIDTFEVSFTISGYGSATEDASADDASTDDSNEDVATAPEAPAPVVEDDAVTAPEAPAPVVEDDFDFAAEDDIAPAPAIEEAPAPVVDNAASTSPGTGNTTVAVVISAWLSPA